MTKTPCCVPNCTAVVVQTCAAPSLNVMCLPHAQQAAKVVLAAMTAAAAKAQPK